LPDGCFKKKLGFRMLMDVIPLDASLVKVRTVASSDQQDWPVFITVAAVASGAR
jgi:hypothetical protein